MNTNKQLFILTLALCMGFFFTSCTDDNDGEAQGTVRVELTDGPLDDAQVEGVFITVTSVEVDGQALAEFNGRQTIELSAYQNGSTRLLGSDLLEAGAYTDLRLLLDMEADANGNSPGCYVLTTNGTRHPLTIEGSSTGMVRVGSGSFDITDQQTTDVVIDFDLRKALRYDDNSNQDQYDFVSNTDLSAAVRLVAKAEAGMVRGQVNRNSVVQNDARVVVYAYRAGSYNESTETQLQGSGQVLFANAVSSASVNSAGEYTLAFLEKGSYELVFATYRDENNDGTAEFQGTCNIGLLGNIGVSPGTINVEAGFTVNLDVSILSIRP